MTYVCTSALSITVGSFNLNQLTNDYYFRWTILFFVVKLHIDVLIIVVSVLLFIIIMS